ncbi:3,4-dihydroxy-2-butanone-4-phosphate synthase [Sphingomonas hengshuiensis]|uniref:3,4-dihydroxy-2-butanone 4-phosphate synthase n=1 Tax=Sphingomonas hengshuiensis TaxID=1609977 RepID=A0A7U4LEI2_9SPHN|nr:3,4-dihydroxy-2-butanone-4-phosphate synthase [Sphingomonas hengshuiensis]AJP71233.1 3,4-dihydroxy-2-butanone 4-phosphate synthase [Sphingomonas hengshuiensis]
MASLPKIPLQRAFLSSPEEIIDEARNGRMFILVDDEDRENEGDLIIPAQMATPDAVNFMARFGCGLICLALSKARVDELGLAPMTPNNGTQFGTAFTVSIEARDGVTTGISAADRARTIAVAIDSGNGPEHIVTPGHVFPLIAREGGVLVRAGHTEAAVDVSRLAGLNPSAVICEVLNDDGTMARLDDLVAFSQLHNLKIGTIRDLIAYRRRYDHLVEKRAEMQFRSRWGADWRIMSYRNKVTGSEVVALVKGDIDPAGPVLVRMHVHSPLADLFAEEDSRSGMLDRAMMAIAEAGSGVVVVLSSPAPDLVGCVIRARQEGREESGGRMVAVREYGIGAQVLTDLGIHRITLLSNSNTNYVGLDGHGIEIVGQQPLARDN